MGEWQLPKVIQRLREQARWHREILLAMQLGRPIRVVHLKENRVYIIGPDGAVRKEQEG